jgi:thymidine kinase
VGLDGNNPRFRWISSNDATRCRARPHLDGPARVRRIGPRLVALAGSREKPDPPRPVPSHAPFRAGDLPHGRRTGTVEVITGSMFSGKTEELIRRLKRALLARQRVQAFKPRIDNRYDPTRIVSHEAVAVDAVAVATSLSLEERVDDETQVVAIDEAQFFDRGIVEVCERLANRGLRVIAAGLDQDYLGHPFPPMPELMAIAEEVTKVHAVCTVCGGPASRSQRLIAEAQTVLVGGAETYEARCRLCFEPRDVPRTRV